MDSSRLAECLYYKAKIHESTNNMDKAIANFKRVDSIYQKTKVPFIELRDVYKVLFDYHTRYGTEKEQLNSIKKLIKTDSILDYDFQYSDSQIIKKYELPKLEKEKETLENTIKKNARSNSIIYLCLFVSLIISILLIFRFYSKQRLYMKRYDEIINESKILDEVTVETKKKNNLNIPKKIIEEVLENLNEFEKNKGYLDKRITLNSISKVLNTNSSYLSKIINNYKEKSFSKYLNNLRIDYAINQLKSDTRFRNYTINAIARETGFNTAESFSRAFYKEKGIHPSYFIKQLNTSNLK